MDFNLQIGYVNWSTRSRFSTKESAGTAAGLTGFFGYLGGAAFASATMGFIVDAFGWDGGFILLLASCVLAMFFLALTLNTGSVKQKQA